MNLIADEKLIRKKMIDKNIHSITELSRRSKVSKPMIHQYLNGKTPISGTFMRLCNFLELNPNDVIIPQGEESHELE